MRGWVLDEETLAFVRSIEAALLQVGWHCALGGSVLHAGKSDKDLDLIVYPRERRGGWPTAVQLLKLRRCLRAAGLVKHAAVQLVHEHWRLAGSMDEKHVEVWLDRDSRRIDVFVLS